MFWSAIVVAFVASLVRFVGVQGGLLYSPDHTGKFELFIVLASAVAPILLPQRRAVRNPEAPSKDETPTRG